MRRLALIGGTSWLSTVDYYRNVNRLVNERLGGMEFPELLLYSVNFGDLKRNTDAGDQVANGRIFVDAAMRLKAAGAEGILLCANTPHLFAEEVEAATGLPVVHIGTATAEAVREAGITRAALLGTRLTMELEFIRSKLLAKGIEPLVPEREADREWVHQTIFNELGRGELTDHLRGRYLALIDDLAQRGAEGVVLACTEIPLLLSPEQIPMPSFDTTMIHSLAAVEFILG